MEGCSRLIEMKQEAMDKEGGLEVPHEMDPAHQEAQWQGNHGHEIQQQGDTDRHSQQMGDGTSSQETQPLGDSLSQEIQPLRGSPRQEVGVVSTAGAAAATAGGNMLHTTSIHSAWNSGGRPAGVAWPLIMMLYIIPSIIRSFTDGNGEKSGSGANRGRQTGQRRQIKEPCVD